MTATKSPVVRADPATTTAEEAAEDNNGQRQRDVASNSAFGKVSANLKLHQRRV
jgi:hypothetical protein